MSHDPEKSGLQFDHASEATCSESDTSTNPADDSHVEAGVVRRLDLVVVPLLAFSMMIAYMDRGNIGNARVLGMQKDLHLTSSHFLNIIMMFYVGYIFLELPAALTMRYVHPRFVFGVPVIVFGVIAAVSSVADSYAALMVLRVLLGLCEVFINNSWQYLAMWYKPSELAFRTAAMFSMPAIAGVVSGLIAYGCGRHIDGANGIAAWQWLFIIEGSVTVAVALAVTCFLPGLPDRSLAGSWLFRTEEEKHVIMQRSDACRNTTGERFSARQLLIGVKDLKTWLCALLVGTSGIGIGAFGVFLPTFIKDFGYGVLDTQLFSIIPYAVGLVTLLAGAYLSDRLQKRFIVLMPCMAVVCIGFIVLMTTTDKTPLMIGVCLVTAGAYPALVIGAAWQLQLHAGYTKRALSIWVLQIFIQGYGITASQIYRTPPRYLMGHGIAMGLYVLGMIAACALYVICQRGNAKKERRREQYVAKGDVDPDMEKTVEELCDFHPGHFYML